jgi:HEAT repeat protein
MNAKTPAEVNMKALRWLIVCCLGVCVGCGGGNKKQFGGREMPAPKEPPPVPARKDEPPDPGLVEAARQELVAASENRDPVLRENALEAVRQLNDPVAAAVIPKALDDAEKVVRFRAALAAGAHQLAAAREKLESMVGDDDPHLRIAVIYALHRLGVTDYTHDLEKTAVSPEPGVRADTAFVLGMLGEKSALKILKVMARDTDPVVRQRAWEAMWRLGDQGVVDELVGLTMSKYADDQMLGLLALAAPRVQSVREAVRSGLTSEHLETCLVAARAMGQLGSDEGYGLALQGAKSNDARQRFLAALAFGAIGRTDAQGTLRNLMKDKDPRVRVVAAAAVLEIAGGREVSPKPETRMTNQ